MRVLRCFPCTPLVQLENRRGVRLRHASEHPVAAALSARFEPARQTVVREVKGGQILEIERDDDHGRTVYEVEFIENQTKYEIDVAPDGSCAAIATDPS